MDVHTSIGMNINVSELIMLQTIFKCLVESNFVSKILIQEIVKGELKLIA